jgi:hypothetical protein
MKKSPEMNDFKLYDFYGQFTFRYLPPPKLLKIAG